MYAVPGKPSQEVTTPAADVLADDTGEALDSLQESLNQARLAAQAASASSSKAGAAKDVSKRLDSAFEVAQRILELARLAKARRT